jgi:hypothetical protein
VEKDGVDGGALGKGGGDLDAFLHLCRLLDVFLDGDKGGRIVAVAVEVLGVELDPCSDGEVSHGEGKEEVDVVADDEWDGGKWCEEVEAVRF